MTRIKYGAILKVRYVLNVSFFPIYHVKRRQRNLPSFSFKNGNILRAIVNYVEFNGDAIIYTVDKQCHDAVQAPVRVQMRNVAEFYVRKINCNGWEDK